MTRHTCVSLVLLLLLSRLELNRNGSNFAHLIREFAS